VLVDIENVAGGAIMTVDEGQRARLSILRTGLIGTQDQIVVGTSHTGVLGAGLAWPRCRLVVRSGPDGADLALLSVICDERIAERFDEVLLVTGDGIFAEAVAALGVAGVSVTVVARSDSCSKRLRMAASHLHLIDPTQIQIGDAA
jgi:hypothetical protein